jgi:hypothetical protein
MLPRLLASDPGLNRLRMALQSVLTIAAAMAAEWGLVRLTHALWIDAHGVPAAIAAAQHHGMTVIAVMIGAVVGMIASFAGGMFPSSGRLLIGYAAMPVFMIAGLALGLGLAGSRTVSLLMLVVILAAGAYSRRWGPLGFVGGQMFFMGDFFGFFLSGSVHLRDLGWLAAEIGLGALVALLAQFTLFYPGRRAALARLQRSYDARRRDLVELAIRMIDEREEAPRLRQLLDRRLVALNETALMIDATLNQPGSIPPGWSAEALHQILFDIELAAGNMGRFAGYLTTSPRLSEPTRARIREALVAVRDGDVGAAELAADRLLTRVEEAIDEEDTVRVVLHRFALSVLGHCGAQRSLREARKRAASGVPVDAGDGLESPVILMAGWLPGTAMVSADASTVADPVAEGGRLRRILLGHVPLAPNVRVAIQMAIAVGASILVGEILSGRRFYWAVIAAFVTFMGANSATEQVRKGVNRVIGTAVGAVVGALLAHLVGDRGWLAVAVILVAIFFGIYFMRISYVFMVLGITVMVSQLYVQLDEFSDSFLLLRLEETALGAGITAVTVLCVLPLRTGRVARLSGLRFLDAIDEVTAAAVAVVEGRGEEAELRAAVRRMDDAYQTLLAVTKVLRVPLFERAGSQRDRFMTAAGAARNYARNLLVDVPATGSAQVPSIGAARERFSASLGVLRQWLETGAADGAYVRSASLFDRSGTGTGSSFGEPLELTLRDLELLDGALATMAAVAGLEVEALDATAA